LLSFENCSDYFLRGDKLIMALSVGIVGLPNVGKSTFFNAITNCSAEAQNYPFCTIEPNTGIVPIPESPSGGVGKS